MTTEYDRNFLNVDEIEAWKRCDKFRFLEIFELNDWKTLPTEKIPVTYFEYVSSFPQYKAGINVAIDKYILPRFPYYWLVLQIRQQNVPEFPKLYLDLPMGEAQDILTEMRLENGLFRIFINKIVVKKDRDYLRFFGSMGDEIGFLILFFAYANGLNLKDYVEYIPSSIQIPQFYNYLEEIKDHETAAILQDLFSKSEKTGTMRDVRPISVYSGHMILSPEYIYRYNKENLDTLAHSDWFRKTSLSQICSIYNNGNISGKKSASRFLHAIQGRDKLTDAVINELIPYT